jgi:hypothetical protein
MAEGNSNTSSLAMFPSAIWGTTDNSKSRTGRNLQSVIVREVPLSWNEPHLLTVHYDLEACIKETPPPPVPLCRIVFRVANSDGKWVSAASIQMANPRSARLTADEYGRASSMVKVGDEVGGSISAFGYEPADFNISCTLARPVHEEHVVSKNSLNQ